MKQLIPDIIRRVCCSPFRLEGPRSFQTRTRERPHDSVPRLLRTARPIRLHYPTEALSQKNNLLPLIGTEPGTSLSHRYSSWKNFGRIKAIIHWGKGSSTGPILIKMYDYPIGLIIYDCAFCKSYNCPILIYLKFNKRKERVKHNILRIIEFI